MTRSYKKNPIVGIAHAASEKKDKQAAHGALRVHFRTQMASADNVEEFFFQERNQAHSNLSGHAKDGKQHLDIRVTHVGRATRLLSSLRECKTIRQALKLIGK